MPEWIQNIDWTILHWIQSSLQCNVLDFFMPAITTLGNGGAIWIVAAAAMTISPKYRKYGITMFAALMVGVLIGNVFLKPLIARPRPCWLEAVPLLIPNPADYSFPSGHTLSSVIAAVVLTKANNRFGLAAIPLAGCIAFSRLYLYVHFPSDVLTSVILGIVIGATAVWVMKKIVRRKNA